MHRSRCSAWTVVAALDYHCFIDKLVRFTLSNWQCRGAAVKALKHRRRKLEHHLDLQVDCKQEYPQHRRHLQPKNNATWTVRCNNNARLTTSCDSIKQMRQRNSSTSNNNARVTKSGESFEQLRQRNSSMFDVLAEPLPKMISTVLRGVHTLHRPALALRLRGIHTLHRPALALKLPLQQWQPKVRKFPFVKISPRQKNQIVFYLWKWQNTLRQISVRQNSFVKKTWLALKFVKKQPASQRRVEKQTHLSASSQKNNPPLSVESKKPTRLSASSLRAVGFISIVSVVLGSLRWAPGPLGDHMFQPLRVESKNNLPLSVKSRATGSLSIVRVVPWVP